MKMLLVLLLIISLSLLAQTQDPQIYEEENILEAEEVQEAEGSEATDKAPERQQDKIQVECVCPAPAPVEEQQEVQAAPQIFPDNAIFNITPAPDPVTQPEEQKEEFNLPPGYLQKLPPGFSNDQYKRIEPY